MDFEIFTGSIATATTDCIVVGVGADQQLTAAAALLDQSSEGFISSILADGDMQGKTAETA